MTSQFSYQSDPIRIVFGAGSVAALRAEADFHKISRLIVLCSPSRTDMARRATASVADRCTGLCDASAPNMPREAFDRVIAEIERHKVDGFVVIGGGSPIGLAKAAAVATRLPYIAIVTTYSGSEMAPRWRIGIADSSRSFRFASVNLWIPPLARCCVRRIAATTVAIGGIADKHPTEG